MQRRDPIDVRTECLRSFDSHRRATFRQMSNDQFEQFDGVRDDDQRREECRSIEVLPNECVSLIPPDEIGLRLHSLERETRNMHSVHEWISVGREGLPEHGNEQIDEQNVHE